VLGAYRFDRYKDSGDDDGGVGEVLVSAHHDVAPAVDRAATLATWVNRGATCRTPRRTT
jgi:hypothetical protein